MVVIITPLKLNQLLQKHTVQQEDELKNKSKEHVKQAAAIEAVKQEVRLLPHT